MVRFVPAIACVAACSFRPGSVPSDGSADAPAETSIDAPVDAPVDATLGESCLARWRDGSVRFAAPVELAGLGIGVDDPFVTPDNLTIFFDGPSAATEEIYASTRANPGAAFGAPQVFASLSTTGDESKASLTGDGLDAFIASTVVGGKGGLDVWEATRTSTSQPFGAFDEANLVSVDGPNNEFDPAISFDGEHLYLAPVFGTSQHVAMAQRQGDRTFATPVQLTELADPGGASDADPATSHDELVIVYSSTRQGSGIPMGRNMWYATRTTKSAAFSTPALIPDVNTDSSDGGPTLSDDACTLYFSSDRDGALHIWVTTMK